MKKYIFIFKSEVMSNLQYLFNIFVGLMAVNGTKAYMEDMYGSNEGTVNLNKAFDTFFEKKYGEETLFVEPLVFINDLKDDITLYYKDKIEDIMHKIPSE